MPRSQKDLMINALFLGKPGTQSGVYYFANQLISEFQKSYPDVMILVSKSSGINGKSIVKVPAFPLKLRFIYESFYRLKYRSKYWLNLDYFLPFRFGFNCPGDAVVIHDFLVYDKPHVVSLFRRLWIKWQFKRTSLFAEKVITVSEFSANRFRQIFPSQEAKCSIIPVPIDLSRFHHFESSAKLDFLNHPYLLTISSPWQHKNLGVLDQIMPSVYANHGVCLIKVGARQKPFKLMDFDFHDCAIYNFGYVSDEILGQLIKSSKAVLAPSTYEGFGMTVYESLGLGIPVIASDLDSYPKVSTLIRVKDYLSSTAWESAINNLLEASTLTNTKHSFDISLYSVSKIAHEYVQVLITE